MNIDQYILEILKNGGEVSKKNLQKQITHTKNGNAYVDLDSNVKQFIDDGVLPFGELADEAMGLGEGALSEGQPVQDAPQIPTVYPEGQPVQDAPQIPTVYPEGQPVQDAPQIPTVYPEGQGVLPLGGVLAFDNEIDEAINSLDKTSNTESDVPTLTKEVGSRMHSFEDLSSSTSILNDVFSNKVDDIS